MSKPFDPALEQQLFAAARMLESTGRFKVLNKLEARDVFNEDDGSKKEILMLLDTETTGLKSDRDKMIEIGYLLIEFSRETGKLYRVLDRVDELEDPGFPLSEETIKLTGLTDEMLAGKTFNRAKITADAARADLVMAHNSGFDRKFVEVEFPWFKTKPFVCSFVNGPWEDMGFSTRKLEFLAFAVGGFFYEAHRAQTDAEATAELISKPAHDGQPILKHIIERGMEATYRVWANNSPFETKDALSEAKYRWSDGKEEGKFKAWFKEGVKDPDAEVAFLAENIYPRAATISIDLILPEDAFSLRHTERQQFDVVPPKKVSLRP